jgi:HEAT repeat protein
MRMIMTTTLRPTGLLPRLLLELVCGLAAASPAYAVDEVIDSVIYTDPDIPAARVVKVFPQRLTALWLQALERPENNLKCQAATTIALAHRRGMPSLETTVTPLLRALDQPEQHPAVRLAAAQALITLDARQAAASLFAHARSDGIEMRNLVEPALARWDYGPVRTVWLERLNQTGLPGRGWLLALQGLGAVREPKAVPRLRELTLSPVMDPIVRLEAARALGAIQTTGLEKDAERLATEKAAPGNVAHLAAASLLRKHRGDEAAKILQRLAVEAEPAAAAVALEGLLDDDPHRVLPLMARVVASPDATVRSHAVEAHRRCPMPDHIPLVAELLDDPHPQVRIGARKALLEVARGIDHGDAVRRQATRLLATGRWRALEQAAILLTLLDHKSAAPRFVELLQFERPEVFLAAAWGLRKLAVPETLPEQLREIERRWQRSLEPVANEPREMIDLQVAQLAQSLGRARYDPAAPMLARFVPKQWNLGPQSRAAAIWALGLIQQKDPPARLVRELIGRLTDESVIMPEDLGVRSMCAVALGRMKAEDAEDSLRKYYPSKLSTETLSNSCGWALEQLTGEKLPASGTVEVIQRGWFLEANDKPPPIP